MGAMGSVESAAVLYILAFGPRTGGTFAHFGTPRADQWHPGGTPRTTVSFRETVMTLNERAWRLVNAMAQPETPFGVHVSSVAGARVLDCGVTARGGLEAGVMLARVCLADLAAVDIVPGEFGPAVQVRTDHPVPACLASQYAGWQISVGKYFAMGSGPMRAAYAKEPLFDHIEGREAALVAVGVLETRKLPTEDVAQFFVEKLGLSADKISLLAAPTASLAGTVQIVARSVETALHKLHELKFDVGQVVAGYGIAPLPPPAKDDLAAIGRTNDAVLYGARVKLWVRCDDDQLTDIGPKVPACSSSDYGAPFIEQFARVGHDFYKIDPLLFSPAVVTLHNLQSGRSFTFGRIDADTVQKSFGL